VPSLRITDVIGSVACEVSAHTPAHTRTHTEGGNLTPLTLTYTLDAESPWRWGSGGVMWSLLTAEGHPQVCAGLLGHHRPLTVSGNAAHSHTHSMPAGAAGMATNGDTMTTDETPTPDPFGAHVAGEAGPSTVAGASEPAMGVRQAARALGITREHLYARIRKGQVRAIDGPNENGQGTVRLVPLSEIERLGMETGFRAHGEVKPPPADDRPMLQLERVTQQLASTRAVLAQAVERPETTGPEADAGGWWGRRRREREQLAAMRARVAEVEAALRSAHTVAGGGLDT